MAEKASNPVGYLVNHPKGVLGEQGIGYDYVIGGDGVFIQSQNEDIVARTQVADCRIRGLAPVGEKFHLVHGLIPASLFETGLNWMQYNPRVERFFSIHWDGEAYRGTIPEQAGTATSLAYRPPGRAVAEFHSHANSRAYFSETDDRDEMGFRIYGVVGRLEYTRPELSLRLGIYGKFANLDWSQIFKGDPPEIRLMRREEHDAEPSGVEIGQK